MFHPYRSTSRARSLGPALAFAALVAACGGDRAPEITVAEEGADGGAVETAPPVAGGQQDGPHLLSPPGAQPVGPGATAEVGEGGTVSGAGLTFDLPAGWETRPPSNSMRLTEATIPGGGDLVVFFFGPGGGGPVEQNIERWIGQMEAAGQPSRDSFTSGPYTVTTVDVEGTLLPSTMGSGPSEPQPDSMLLGAVVEGPGGPWFFKATGPKAALAGQQEAWQAMLRSVRPTQGHA